MNEIRLRALSWVEGIGNGKGNEMIDLVRVKGESCRRSYDDRPCYSEWTNHVGGGKTVDIDNGKRHRRCRDCWRN